MDLSLKFNRLLIMDFSHALHRAIAQPKLWDMHALNKSRTGGIYGSLEILIKESSKYNYFPVAVFDGHLSQRRLSIYDNYKKYKDKQLLVEGELTDLQKLQAEQRAEYISQREVVKDLLKALGIPVIHLEDWEGDDLIYILTKLTKDSIIVSDDKDMLQMICDNDKRCRVCRGMMKEFWDINTLNDMNIDANQYIVCKAICGDPSDNIPSACKGVGDKSAVGLYKIYNESMKILGGFPKDDKELVKICKDLGISKRTAYLNFNENQFLINMLLMDLRYVDNDITQEVVSSLINAVDIAPAIADLEIASQILQNLNIHSLKIDDLLNNLERTRPYISLDSYDPDIPDIITPKIGRLF